MDSNPEIPDDTPRTTESTDNVTRGRAGRRRLRRRVQSRADSVSRGYPSPGIPFDSSTPEAATSADNVTRGRAGRRRLRGRVQSRAGSVSRGHPSPGIPFDSSTPEATTSGHYTRRGNNRPQRGRGRAGRGSTRQQEVRKGSSSRQLRMTMNERQRLEKLFNMKKQACSEMVNGLSQEQLVRFCTEMVECACDMSYDVLKKIKSQQSPEPGPSPRSSVPWCICGNCREMSRDIEKVCCGCQPQNCISCRPEFEYLVLEPQVLNLAILHHNDIWAYHPPNNHETLRYAAYRQYILWRYGRLGRGNLKVIPSCCLWAIRDRFPDPNGQYVDFSLRGGQLV